MPLCKSGALPCTYTMVDVLGTVVGYLHPHTPPTLPCQLGYQLAGGGGFDFFFSIPTKGLAMNALVAICSVVAPATSSPAPVDTSWYGTTHHGEGFVNVKDAQFGAKGDGVTDDTAALQLAINHNRLQAGLPPAPTQRPFAPPSRAVVYLPPGTYVVSDTVVLWFFTHLRGSTLDPPTVLLKSSAAGFGDAGALKPILATAGGCNQSIPWWRDNFHANDMFYNQIHSININAGRGNSGAVGVYWSIAQQTSIRDLHIEGARVGIDVAVTRGYATPLQSSAGLGVAGQSRTLSLLAGMLGCGAKGRSSPCAGLPSGGSRPRPSKWRGMCGRLHLPR